MNMYMAGNFVQGVLFKQNSLCMIEQKCIYIRSYVALLKISAQSFVIFVRMKCISLKAPNKAEILINGGLSENYRG